MTASTATAPRARPASSIFAASTAAPSADRRRRHLRAREATTAHKGTRDILTAESGRFIAAKVYDRPTMAIGLEIRGPAIVEQPDTTTLIEPGWRATVVADGTLIITAD